ncbi:MAG: signal recognition particle protein [Deltaproteobacteria bacterium]|nr:signal recognition particle protein [Deltaproteobacteria bacterium]
MFDVLGEKFSSVFKKLRGYGKLTEKNIEEAVRDVRLALLEADVNVGVVKSFLEKVKDRALGEVVFQNLNPQSQFLKIVHEELVAVLGGAEKTLILEGKPPHVLLLVGLQGCGKTTTAAKLANYFKKKGRHPYLVPADVARPAAIDQLSTLAQKIGVPCWPTKTEDNPVEIAGQAVDFASRELNDIVLVDTAGRLHIDDELMAELGRLKKKFGNSRTLFVADAMTGQEAVKVARAFHDLLKLDGVILTKQDGDAKGGAALSIQSVAGCPIYFTGMGEGIDALEPFSPERLVSRLLDRGDILSLVTMAQEVVDVEQAKELEKKLRKNRFNMEDFRQQLGQMKKLGSLKSLMGFLPGARDLSKQIDLGEAEKGLKKKEAIINSMTLKERFHPEILNGNRRIRIARGSGTEVADVNRLVKEFAQMQKMMKQFSKGKGFPKLF